MILTTLTVVVPLIIWWRQSGKPSLDYEVTYSKPLLGDRERIGDAFHVESKYGNPPDVHVFAVKLGNYGRQPIRAEDFEDALRLRFTTAYLLDAFITDQMPPHLAPEIGLEDIDLNPEAFIEPLLLHPGDSFEVQAFTNGAPDVVVEGRIAGVPSFRERSAVEAQRLRITRYLVPILTAVLVLWAWALLSTLGIAVNALDYAPWVVLLPVIVGAATYLVTRSPTNSRLGRMPPPSPPA